MQFGKCKQCPSLLVFPFLFSLFNLEDRQKILKQKYFFLSIYILSVFLFNSIVFSWFYLTHYSFSDLVYHFHRVVLVDIGKFGIHPIYLSIHCCFSYLFFSSFIFKNYSKEKLKNYISFYKYSLDVFFNYLC